MMRFAPGSPFTSERAMSPEVMHNIEAKYGLDKPAWQQYFSYLGNLAQGDLGPSFKYKDYTVNDRWHRLSCVRQNWLASLCIYPN